MNQRVPSIVAPGTPKWVRRFLDVGKVSFTNAVLAMTLIALFVSSIALIFEGTLAARIAGGALGGLLVVGLFAGAIRATRRSVTPGDWRYKKQPIVGQARALLASAAGRAAEAESLAAKIPTGLDWEKLRPHIDALLWDAAGHAAQVCQLNEQINRLKEPGPEHAELWHQRQGHLDVVTAAADEMLELVQAAVKAADAQPPNDGAVSRKGRRGLRARRSPPRTDQQQEG